jgi:hypothetical protein
MTLEDFSSPPTKTIPRFDYKGYFDCESACKVDLWLHPDKAIVLLTDSGIGTSITNAAESVIAKVYYDLLADKYTKDKCFFAETYGDDIDQVIPRWYSTIVDSVEWKHIGKLKPV